MNSLLDYFMDKSKQDFDIDIVKYGCKLLMSSVVGTLIVLFFALIICKIEDAIIFLITFAFLRKYSGGYHCSTYVRCNFLLLITYFGSVLWMMVEMEIFEYILVLISLAYIVLKAPIKNKNKILNYKQLMKIRKNIKIITLIYFSIMILCWLLSIKSVLGYSIVLTALLMIGGVKVMVKAISRFVAKIFIRLCYNTGVNSVNLASFHYMHEPKEPKSLEKFKN